MARSLACIRIKWTINDFLVKFSSYFFLTFFYKKNFSGWNLVMWAPTSALNLKAMQSLHKELSFPLFPIKFEAKLPAQHRFQLLARNRSTKNPVHSFFCSELCKLLKWTCCLSGSTSLSPSEQALAILKSCSDGGNRRVVLNSDIWFLILHIWSGQSSI